MERIPKPGEFYRHFKDKLYQVLTVAEHTETGEQMVVYQALYGDFRTYVRPLSMFVSEVDRVKYPDVSQKYRFEKVEPEREKRTNEEPAWEETEEEPGLQPCVLAFLDAESWDEKLQILSSMKGKIGEKEIDSIFMALDLQKVPGGLEAQTDALEGFLKTQKRYDGSRLR
ncbi:DUF1653 domain-containing protein [Clostridium sp. MCC353]|uniref:DUF1653 domain-containing protein n=1 Tax=Clostridium sp. MCC353 TaxID=2592646 RepID=UPI001C0340B7|nr:DUF1653 domain-containing protein [Clostridium sp. MCC353]MBT9778762.1 DUF1653 domain-containing protein [Clostridium sp. MCC353]